MKKHEKKQVKKYEKSFSIVNWEVDVEIESWIFVWVSVKILQISVDVFDQTSTSFAFTFLVDHMAYDIKYYHCVLKVHKMYSYYN